MDGSDGKLLIISLINFLLKVADYARYYAKSNAPGYLVKEVSC